MQKLHLVGFTSELDGLILSTRKGAKSGSYVVKLDAAVLDAVADLVPPNGTEGEKGGSSLQRQSSKRRSSKSHEGDFEDDSSRGPSLPVSQLTPRQMQDRLRAGWSIAEVAEAADVSFDWVSRFAAPVLAEQARVISKVRELVYDKPRFGLSAYPVGSAVRRNVAERGIHLADDEYDACWGAHQVEEGLWIVTFRYTSRGRSQQAEWLVDTDGNELSSRNRLGAQLAYIKGRARSRTVSSTPKPVAKRSPARKKVAKKPAVKKKAVVKKAPVKKKAVVKKAPVTKKAATKKAVARKIIPSKKNAVAKKAAPVVRKKVTPARHVPVYTSPGFKAPPRPKPTTSPAASPPVRVSTNDVRSPSHASSGTRALPSLPKAPARQSQPQAQRSAPQDPVPQRVSAAQITERVRQAQAARSQPVIRAERAQSADNPRTQGTVQRGARRRSAPLSARKR